MKKNQFNKFELSAEEISSFVEEKEWERDDVNMKIFFPFQKKLSGINDQKRVLPWGKLFDKCYYKLVGDSNSEKDSSVWKSSYTGKSFSVEEMLEWINGVIDRILPALKETSKVLEIGCGNGMILGRIESKIGSYTGIDCSFEAINSLEKHPLLGKKNKKTEFYHMEAIDVSNLHTKKYDVVIINSVIQYFPCLEYLLDVLEKIEKITSSNALIFIGDIRSNESLYRFYKDLSINSGQNIDKFIHREKETTYHPIAFKNLHKIFPWVSYTEVKTKSGKYRNELNKFRYDVCVYKGNQDNKKEQWKKYVLDDKEEINFKINEYINESMGKPFLVKIKSPWSKGSLRDNQEIHHAIQASFTFSDGSFHYDLIELNNVLELRCVKNHALLNGYHKKIKVHELSNHFLEINMSPLDNKLKSLKYNQYYFAGVDPRVWSLKG